MPYRAAVDVVHVADLSPGSAAVRRAVAAATAEATGGKAVAVLHVGADLGLAPSVRTLVDAGTVSLILPADATRARLAVIHGADPASLTDKLASFGDAEVVADATTSVAMPPEQAASSPAQRSRRPVLFVTTNGAGVGHLTRLMAMARRCDDAVEPVILSMSQAVGVAATEGFRFEYLPSRGDLGIGPRRWNALLSERLGELLGRVQPAAVVFDGTYPYRGLVERTRELPTTRLVWSRRAMWKAGLGARQLESAGEFDLILEPGELAAEADRGATATRLDAIRVRPITLLDREDLLARTEACAALGLDPGRPAVLVTMGAGNIADQDSELGMVVAELSAVPELQIVLTRSVIADHRGPVAGDVHGVSVYPISRYLQAFDFAVSACGYNSFHELVYFGLPSIFVPTDATMDDQARRAGWAQSAGVGLHLPEVTPHRIKAAVATMASQVARERFRQRCLEVSPGNGARDAMSEVERLLGIRATDTGAA